MVWNERTGNLVSGHQRLKVLKEMGVEELEVTVVDLPPDEEAALNVALNKIEGAWDFAALGDVLTGLKETGFDLDLTGFSPWEVQAILEGWDPEKVENGPPPDTYTITVRGVSLGDRDVVVKALEEAIESVGFNYEVKAV